LQIIFALLFFLSFLFLFGCAKSEKIEQKIEQKVAEKGGAETEGNEG
jgi:hypothetical protein